jgi:predicted AlkP superfamily phosphohydrolase/phosphomutase
MVAIDAADLRIVRRWMQDGSLPNLRRLCEKGRLAPLRSPDTWLSGATWPTFYTGTPPEMHGLYHFLQWDPDRMSYVRPNANWLPLKPFWRRIASESCKVLILDPPSTYTPEPICGIEVIGYAAHDHLHGPASFPRNYIGEIKRRFGAADQAEMTLGESASAARRLTDFLVGATDKLTRLAVDLIAKEDWRFALVCYTATHRAGHRLWHAEGAEDGAPSDALKSVYVACDRGLGEVLHAAGDDVACVVFSLHGMEDNTSRVDILEQMLDRILGRGSGEQRTAGGALASALRGCVPEHLKSRIKARLPMAMQDRLSNARSAGGIDWSSKQAFSLISDLLGYVRINLRGRERFGIVEPGTEHERLCETISTGLSSFRDADSGQPVVERVIPMYKRAAMSGGPSTLPDLVVRWGREPARHHRSIVSTSFGSITWPTLNGHPTGRSGNHCDGGFLICSGSGFDASREISEASVLDLMPTAYSLLGIEIPAEARGHPISGWTGVA